MRKLFSVLLALAMIISATAVLFSCGEEEHEHTYSEGWKYDTVSHWQLTNCTEHDVQKANEAAHSYNSGSDECKVCGYNNHAHTESAQWSTDDYGHWHEFTCCPEVVPTVIPHSGYEEDEICDGCHHHVHTHSNEYLSDATGHWYRATCEHTDAKVKFSTHSGMDDCVCDSCSYADHKTGNDWESDNTKHWHKAGCARHNGQHVDEGAHDYDPATNKCSVCGYDDPSKKPTELPIIPA